MDAASIVVQILGLGISAGLFFIGYANTVWIKRISFGMCAMTAAQSFLLGQMGVLTMNLVNLAYYSMLLLEGRLRFVQSPVYKVVSMGVAIGAAAFNQYFILGWGLWSPGTFALLGGFTGLLMALMERFVVLKVVTLLNVGFWVSYYLMVGSYTNLIGNALVLFGLVVSVWRHVHKGSVEPAPITASGVTVPVDTGNLHRIQPAKDR